MNAKVMLLSKKDGDIEKFLNKFLNKKIELEKSNIWQKDFSNPIEISENCCRIYRQYSFF